MTEFFRRLSLIIDQKFDLEISLKVGDRGQSILSQKVASYNYLHNDFLFNMIRQGIAKL